MTPALIESEDNESAAGTTEDQVEPASELLPEDVFSSESAFCLAEDEDSAFTLACNQGALNISQNDNRIKSDITLFRDYAVETDFSHSGSGYDLDCGRRRKKATRMPMGFILWMPAALSRHCASRALTSILKAAFKPPSWKSKNSSTLLSRRKIRLGGQENHWKLVLQCASLRSVRQRRAGRPHYDSH